MMEFWHNKKVLVIGGNGFLGSKIVYYLDILGSRVVIFDIKTNPEYGATIEQVVGSIKNYEQLKQVIAKHRIDIIIHLAAQPFIHVANKCPKETFEINIKGTWDVLEAAREVGDVRAIVIASSDRVYSGVPIEKLPYTEEMALQGIHPYDMSKNCADLIGTMYAKTYSLPVGITRCSNLYGEGDLNFGNRLIPTIAEKMHKKEKYVFDRTDGSSKRDYLYVDDAVIGYLTLARKLYETPEKISGEAFNFSSGQGTSVKELVNKIYNLFGYKIAPEYGKKPSNEIADIWLSSAKAKRLLNWAPSFNFDDSISETIRWYLSYFKTNHGIISPHTLGIQKLMGEK